jgi:hypothetical protein
VELLSTPAREELPETASFAFELLLLPKAEQVTGAFASSKRQAKSCKELLAEDSGNFLRQADRRV